MVRRGGAIQPSPAHYDYLDRHDIPPFASRISVLVTSAQDLKRNIIKVGERERRRRERRRRRRGSGEERGTRTRLPRPPRHPFVRLTHLSLRYKSSGPEEKHHKGKKEEEEEEGKEEEEREKERGGEGQ